MFSQNPEEGTKSEKFTGKFIAKTLVGDMGIVVNFNSEEVNGNNGEDVSIKSVNGEVAGGSLGSDKTLDGRLIFQGTFKNRIERISFRGEVESLLVKVR